MGQTFNPLLWKEHGLALIAVDNIFQMIEFPYIDDCSGSIAADEYYHDTQQDHEHVDLLPEFSLWSKGFELEFAEVSNDLEVDDDQGNQWDYNSEDDSAVGCVVLDVVAVLPQVSSSIYGVVFISCCIGDNFFIWEQYRDIILYPVNFAFQELGQVQQYAEKSHWKNIVPSLPVLRR